MVMTRSSVEAKFWAMAQGICEILWIKGLLKEFKLEPKELMMIYYDDKVANNIAHYSIQHDYTKHVEVDRHLIKEKIESGRISTPFVTTKQ